MLTRARPPRRRAQLSLFLVLPGLPLGTLLLRGVPALPHPPPPGMGRPPVARGILHWCADHSPHADPSRSHPARGRALQVARRCGGKSLQKRRYVVTPLAVSKRVPAAELPDPTPPPNPLLPHADSNGQHARVSRWHGFQYLLLRHNIVVAVGIFCFVRLLPPPPAAPPRALRARATMRGGSADGEAPDPQPIPATPRLRCCPNP